MSESIHMVFGVCGTTLYEFAKLACICYRFKKPIPPMGLKNKITLEYLPCNDHFALPRAQACFGVVKLPTVHTDKEQFFLKLDQGVLNSVGHFGEM